MSQTRLFVSGRVLALGFRPTTILIKPECLEKGNRLRIVQRLYQVSTMRDAVQLVDLGRNIGVGVRVWRQTQPLHKVREVTQSELGTYRRAMQLSRLA